MPDQGCAERYPGKNERQSGMLSSDRRLLPGTYHAVFCSRRWISRHYACSSRSTARNPALSRLDTSGKPAAINNRHVLGGFDCARLTRSQFKSTGHMNACISEIIAVLLLQTVVLPATAASLISDPPASQSVLSGADVLLKVGVADMQPLNLSWSVNGSSIAGANDSTLILPHVTPEDSGSYQVIVWNAMVTNTALARLQVNALAHAVIPVPVTGWNTDVIVEVGSQPVANWPFDGLGIQWIESGFMGHADGFPNSRQFTSAVNTNVLFQLQPYDSANVLLLSSKVDLGLVPSVPPDRAAGILTLSPACALRILGHRRRLRKPRWDRQSRHSFHGRHEQ